MINVAMVIYNLFYGGPGLTTQTHTPEEGSFCVAKRHTHIHTFKHKNTKHKTHRIQKHIQKVFLYFCILCVFVFSVLYFYIFVFEGVCVCVCVCHVLQHTNTPSSGFVCLCSHVWAIVLFGTTKYFGLSFFIKIAGV